MCTQPCRFWLLAAKRTWAKSCYADHLVAQKWKLQSHQQGGKKKKWIQEKMKKAQNSKPSFQCHHKVQLHQEGAVQRRELRHTLSPSVHHIITKFWHWLKVMNMTISDKFHTEEDKEVQSIGVTPKEMQDWYDALQCLPISRRPWLQNIW